MIASLILASTLLFSPVSSEPKCDLKVTYAVAIFAEKASIIFFQEKEDMESYMSTNDLTDTDYIIMQGKMCAIEKHLGWRL